MCAARVNTKESFTPEVVVLFNHHVRRSQAMRKEFHPHRKSYPLFLWITEGYFLSIFSDAGIDRLLSTHHVAFKEFFLRLTDNRLNYSVSFPGDFSLKFLAFFLNKQQVKCYFLLAEGFSAKWFFRVCVCC